MTEKKPIPLFRPRKEETEAVVYMLCSADALIKRGPDIEKQLKKIPGGWRDFKLAISILNRLSDTLERAFTPEKRRSFEAMIPDLRYSIRYHKRAGRQEEGMSGILTTDLDLLCAVGIEYCCKICDGSCDRCDLGKVFDSMLETNREPGESYAFMQMDLPGFDHVGIGGKKHA